MSGLYLLGARSLGRPAANGETAPANPATVNPADYGTAIAWYDPTAGSPTGYTLDGGSKVSTLKNRITAGTPMGDMTPYVSSSGPAITTVGGLNALNFTAATESRLRWTGTAKVIRGFAIVFSVPAAGVSDADRLLIDSPGTDELLINDPGDPLLISEAGAFIAGWLADGLGISVGEVAGSILREVVGVRGGAADADPDDYQQAIDLAGGEVEETSVYILAGRWNGSRWELYLNSNYDRANDSAGSITTNPTTGVVWLGGCGGSSQATANVRIQHVGFFSSAPALTPMQNYLAALATAFSVALSTTRPTPPEITASTLTVAYRGIGFVNAGANAAAGTNAVDTSSVTITSAPTKGRIQVQDNGRIVYNPNENQSDTTDSFSYIIRDTAGIPSNEVTVAVTIQVNPDVGGGGTGSADSYEGLGFGCAMAGVNLYPHSLDESKREAMVLRNPYTGAIDAIGFNLTSNQMDSDGGEGRPDSPNRKSMGTGMTGYRVTLTRAQVRGQGDGSNFPQKPDFSDILMDQVVHHGMGNGNGGEGAFARHWHKLCAEQEFYAYHGTPPAFAVLNSIFLLSLDPGDTPELEPVRFATTGTLPGGFSAGTDYWLKKVSRGVYRVATSFANAGAGTFIDITTAGTGRHRLANSMTAVAATDVLTFRFLSPGNFAKVRFTTTGTLPGGLSTATDYWLIRETSTTAKVASSLSNAQAGTAINITSTGTGTHAVSQHLIDCDAGEYLCLVVWPQASAPGTNYLSINQPAYRTGSTTTNIPFNWTPARHFGPYYAADNAYVLAENATGFPNTYNRDLFMYGTFDIHYADGEVIGPGYWQTGGDTRNFTFVGRVAGSVNRRVRQRWRHVTGTMTVRYVWVWVWFDWSAKPSGSLTLTLNRINNIGASETRTELATDSLAPNLAETNDVPPKPAHTSSPGDIEGWSNAAPSTPEGLSGLGDWCRFDLGAAGIAITDGEDYEVLFSTSETTQGQLYYLYRIEHNITRQVAYDIEASTLNLWRSRAGQSDADLPADAEWTDAAGDASWTRLSMFSAQRTTSLSVWFEKK